MVRFLTGVVLLSALWRSSAVLTNAVVSDGVGHERRPLVRSQGMTESLTHLSPAGQMVNGEKQTSSAKNTGDCQLSFVLGPMDYENNGECETDSEEELILSREDCEEAVAAAKKAGITDASAGAGHTAPFSMADNSTYLDQHPRGCFKMKTTNVFYFNPVGYKPDHVLHNWTLDDGKGGFPVCTRARFVNGTISGQTVNCPTNYVAMDTTTDTTMGPPIDMFSNTATDNCRTAAQCLTREINEDMFTVGAPPPTQTNPTVWDVEEPVDDREPWACEYNYMPKGCFIRENDRHVYFNAPQKSADGSIIEPTNPTCTATASSTVKCSAFIVNRRRRNGVQQDKNNPPHDPDDPTGVEVPLCIAAKWYGSNPAITVNGQTITR